jgi:hypothetical protein
VSLDLALDARGALAVVAVHGGRERREERGFVGGTSSRESRADIPPR